MSKRKTEVLADIKRHFKRKKDGGYPLCYSHYLEAYYGDEFFKKLRDLGLELGFVHDEVRIIKPSKKGKRRGA